MIPRFYRKEILSFLLTFLITLGLFAQKPKLGLVLSGGGAKGIAHVGVLKAMERAGLKPDYITGTSMGSIIGGLYSIGYSADQIEQIITSLDWNQILSNNIPMNYISYEEKEYYNRFLLELPIVDGKVGLPSGLIEGQMLSEALNHYTWPAMKYKDFDDLPIPFRCIATDASNGKEIIFKDGSLAEAMRASMAIPTAFTAADLDSTMAVDGGVVNNFPADVLKEMGADIIIGVNVTKGFVPADQNTPMTSILMQLSMLRSNELLPQNEALCDVYLQPDMTGYNNASFSKYAEILEIGNDIGKLYESEFDSLATILGKQEPPTGIEVDEMNVVIGDIELSGNKLFTDDVIMGKLGIQIGDTLNPSEVEEGIRRVYGINGFNKVEYRMRLMEGRMMSLKVKMHEKPPTTFRTAFHYDNTFSAGILLNIQFRDLLLNNSRTILAADISVNPRFRFDYYKYIGAKKKAALNLRYDYFYEQIPLYERGRKIDLQKNIENSVSLNILSTQSLKHSFLMGANFEHNRFNSEYTGIFPLGVDYGDLVYLKGRMGYTSNTLNNQNYPTHGSERLLLGDMYFESSYRAVFSDGVDSLVLIDDPENNVTIKLSENQLNSFLDEVTPSLYGTLFFRSIDFIEILPKFQVIPHLAVGFIGSYDSVGTLFNQFSVGGLQRVKPTDVRFIGLNYAEQFYDNFVSGGLFFQNVVGNFYFKYGANVLFYNSHVPLNRLDLFEPTKLLSEQNLLGYGAELTYRSLIGPISIGISSNTDDGFVRYYFAVGYSFNQSD